MGHPTKFDGSNLVFRAPPGASDVQDLHVFHNGVHNVSCWELTPEELVEINKTGRVYLSLMSGRMYPPSYVGSEESVRAIVADSGAVWKKEQPDGNDA